MTTTSGPGPSGPGGTGEQEAALIDPETMARLGVPQSLDDAISFRLARRDAPCPDCAPARECEDHAQDARLVTGYQERHGTVLAEILAGLDPGEVDQAMRHGDGVPPTALAFSMVMRARLRELAADGPVITRLDGGLIILELDGDTLAETPLEPGGDPAAP